MALPTCNRRSTFEATPRRKPLKAVTSVVCGSSYKNDDDEFPVVRHRKQHDTTKTNC